jgi:FtsH-binding integral membrane protein
MFFALIVAWIVFTILLRIIKTTVINALMVAGIVFLLQVGYGITLRDILNFLVQLPQQFSQPGR